MKQSTIIFDFDGTIADSFPLMVRIFNRLAPKYGYKPLSDADIEGSRGKSARDLIRALGIPKLKLPIVFNEGRKAFRDEMHTVQAIAGMEDALRKLQEKYTLGIVTSNSVENVEEFITRHSIEVFDFIYSEKSIFGKGKVLRGVVKKYKLQPETVTYVGDEVRDIDAARESNIRVISVTW
jgi:phosphoglycolate phosphatase